MKENLDVTRFFAAEYASLLCSATAAVGLVFGQDTVATIAAAWVFLVGIIFSVGAGYLLGRITVTPELFAHHYRRLHAPPATAMNAVMLVGVAVYTANLLNPERQVEMFVLIGLVAWMAVGNGVRLLARAADRIARERLGITRIGIVAINAWLLSVYAGIVVAVVAIVVTRLMWRRLDLGLVVPSAHLEQSAPSPHN